MVKRLTNDDQMTREQYLQHIQQYTDADAHRHGYPNLDVMRLEYQLGEIAGKWRRTKDERLVEDYERILYKMILKGYDVTTLPIQDQLPPDLMPELPPPAVQMAIQNVYQLAE